MVSKCVTPTIDLLNSAIWEVYGLRLIDLAGGAMEILDVHFSYNDDAQM